MDYEIKNLYRASYLERPQNKAHERVSQEIEGVFRVLGLILILRVIFNLLQILPQSLERAIAALSYPLVAPFYLLLRAEPVPGTFEWIAVFALAIYSIIGYMLVHSTRAGIVSTPAEEFEEL